MTRGEQPAPRAQAAVAGASYMVLVMVLQRLLTFGVNQYVLRFLLPEQLGFVSSLELQLSTLLFLSREGLRVALLREDVLALAPERRRAVVNVSWLAVPLCAAAALGAAWLRGGGAGGVVWLYSGAAVLEALSEPLFVAAQSSLRFGLRATAEAAAVVARSLAALVGVSYLGLGVAAFGWAQLAFAAVLTGAYYGWFAARGPVPLRALLPSGGARLEWPALRLAGVMTLQSLVKHVLTEGDRIVLQAVATQYDQGVYALVANYGGLAARLLFAPVEEASRALFAQAPRAEAAALLKTLMRLMLLVGLVFAVFGSAFAPLVVQLLAGPRWFATEAPRVLAFYCGYVPFMAVNGLTEAFFYSVGSAGQLSRMAYWNVGFFVVYAATAAAAIPRLGTVGLVLANCVNLALRIGYCAQPGFPRAALPNAPTLAAFAAAAVALHGWVPPTLGGLAVGVLLGVAVLGVVAATDREFVGEVVGLVRSRRSG